MQRINPRTKKHASVTCQREKEDLCRKTRSTIRTKRTSIVFTQRKIIFSTITTFLTFLQLKALRIKEGLKKIQGSVLGTMLDFLSKELRRLLDERKAHAMCLLYEREREAREAVEAHRRQLELRRRREHDEMFKQVKSN